VMFQLRSDRARVRDLLAWVTAASPEPFRERTSGADLHTEGPRDGTLAGSAGAGSAPGARSEPARRSSEPAMDVKPLNSGGRATGTRGAPPPKSGSSADPEPPGTKDGPNRPRVDADMEDWLL
jgi:hypothetical protein